MEWTQAGSGGSGSRLFDWSTWSHVVLSAVLCARLRLSGGAMKTWSAAALERVGVPRDVVGVVLARSWNGSGCWR